MFLSCFRGLHGLFSGVAMNYYRTVTFQPPTETLTNFPVLVRIQNDRMRSRILSPYGWDVCFELDGTRLPFELDWYDAGSGSGAWWVQMPTLSSSAPTSIKMLYGDSSITTNQSDPNTVWADYHLVYHFADTANIRSSVGSFTATLNEGTRTWDGISLVSNAITGRAMQFNMNGGQYTQDSAIIRLCDAVSDIREGGMTLLATDCIAYNSQYGFWMSSMDSYFNYALKGNAVTLRGGSQTPTILPDSTTTAGGHYNFACYGVDTTYGTCQGLVANGASQSCSGSSYVTLKYGLYFYGTGRSSTYPTRFGFDECRISKVSHGLAWLLYEQKNAIEHATCTAYSGEFYADGTPMNSFMPWIFSTQCLD